MKKNIFLFLLTAILFPDINGNNLQIGSISVSTSGGNQYLNFSISWENSWRVNNGPTNWDAVWIFVKRRDCAGLQWRHVNLSPQDADHTAGTPLSIDAYADKKGVMVYRSTFGAGNISNVTLQVKLDSVVTGNYDYKVFGIEMVYVPEGSFYLGDGFTGNCFLKFGSSNPYLMNSESAINLVPNTDSLWSPLLGNTGYLGPDYPKGFKSFYCMKYELSQGQYAAFLNTIPQDAATTRYPPYYGNSRFTITGSWPALAATAPNRACNWLGFKDLAAYLDWSALSPMTEMEFEKACRGAGNFSVGGEFAWGGTAVQDADSIAAGTDGLPNEACGNSIDTGKGLANYGNDSVLGPLRCGFAASNATDRFKAGASYYGIMELSGNLFELCYNVFFSIYGTAAQFNGSHGDGELATSPNAGFANQSWPVETGYQDAFELSSVIAKGGGWSSNNLYDMYVSDRTYVVYSGASSTVDINTRANCFGGRGVSRRQ